MSRQLAEALVLAVAAVIIAACTSGTPDTSSHNCFSGVTVRVFQMVYYRTDLLQKDGLQPPQTWDDYISIAQHFQGKDLNGDGKADYGSCLAMKRSAQSYWMYSSIASAFIQSQGTKQGAFF